MDWLRRAFRAPELISVARLFVLTAGRAALWRALPLYFGIGIGAFVLFAGNGMDAATVTRQAELQLPFRLTLLGSWVLATLPAARVWLGTPETFFLRALPVSRHSVVAVLGLGCLVMQAPWAVLWLRGSGLGAALWAVGVAAALQAGTVAGLRRWSDAAVPSLVVGAACVGPTPVDRGVAAAIGAIALVFSIGRAWRRAAERATEGRGWVSSGGPLAAQLTALGVALGRGHSSVIFRAVLFGVGAAWLAALGVAHGAADDLGVMTLCLSLWAPAVTLSAAALSGPVLRAERSFEWMLRASGAPPRVYAAPSLLLAAFGAALALFFALIVAALSDLDRWSLAELALSCITVGAAASVVACSVARRAVRGDGRDAGRLVLANLGSLSAWTIAITTLGARALPLMALVSFGALAWDRSTVLRRARRVCSA